MQKRNNVNRHLAKWRRPSAKLDQPEVIEHPENLARKRLNLQRWNSNSPVGICIEIR